MTLKFDGWFRAPLLCYFKLGAAFRSHWWIQTGVTSGNAQFGSKSTLILAVWPCNLTDDLQKAPFLCYFKLCVSFRSHWWIQTGVTVRKRPIWVKFDDFKSRATLKFDGWLCKTIGHLFYATSSFMHHFVVIGEFKLQSSGSNSTLFRDLEIWRMTFKNNRAPLHATSSFVHHFVANGEFKLELQSGNAQSRSNLTIFRAVLELRWNL